jgi:hypothetical protein
MPSDRFTQQLYLEVVLQKVAYNNRLHGMCQSNGECMAASQRCFEQILPSKLRVLPVAPEYQEMYDVELASACERCEPRGMQPRYEIEVEMSPQEKTQARIGAAFNEPLHTVKLELLDGNTIDFQLLAPHLDAPYDAVAAFCRSSKFQPQEACVSPIMSSLEPHLPELKRNALDAL